MPNHVRTMIKFKYIDMQTALAIVNRITKELEDDVYPLNRIIDFDKIIPEPKTEDECPEKYRVNIEESVAVDTESHLVVDDSEKPWFDWYGWRLKHWGTKWNAYDSYTRIKKTNVEFVFSTAWTPATPIFEKLTELGYDMEIVYADENLGYNCGKIIYNASTKEFNIRTEEDYKDPYSFAKKIWEKY